MIKFKVPNINLSKNKIVASNNCDAHICAFCKNNIITFFGDEIGCKKKERLRGETITNCNFFNN